MSWVINMVAKLGGVSKLWGFLDGYKTKVAGVAGLLSGAAGLAQQVVVLIDKHDAAAVLAFIKALPTDQSWLALLAGLATLGIGHKLEKASELP